MNTLNGARLEAMFEQQVGTQLQRVLRPISDQMPAGADLRATQAFRRLQRARQEDDPSLPKGQWETETKRADWSLIVADACTMLTERSKDLQLMTWLMEALVHVHGFGGLAAGVHALSALCERFWPSLHPMAVDADIEHRANVISAADRLLAPLLLTRPLASVEGTALTWDGLLRAQRQVQLTEAEKTSGDAEPLVAYRRRLGCVGVAELRSTLSSLEDALVCLAQLRATLLELASGEMPYLGASEEVVRDVSGFVRRELQARGASLQEVTESIVPEAQVDPALGAAGDVPEYGPARRDQLYMQLSALAELLMQVDPHSPTPYLLKRAVHWGGLSTAELYEELFVKSKGTLSIFELMGVSHPS